MRKTKEAFFKTERQMQEWFSSELKKSDCLKELIVNADEIENSNGSSMAEARVLDNYKYCLTSLNIVDVITEDQNISFKNGDVLRPDFLLFAPESQNIIVVELKNLASPSRQVGTEVGAYMNEVRSYIPFIADGSMISIIISTAWPTLLNHYIFHEIFWLQRNVLCLRPVSIEGTVQLQIIEPAVIVQDRISFTLGSEHLGGYQLCLYDDELYQGGDPERLTAYLPQMKTAIASMAVKGNAQKNNGFAFLWKSAGSPAPYNITILNIAPFQTLERMYHDENFIPSDMYNKFVEVLCDHDPDGCGQSLDTISGYGERFLKEFCSVRPEGYFTWDIHRRHLHESADLISFFGWGIFGELYADKLLQCYRRGELFTQADAPHIGWDLINELVDPNYSFFKLQQLNESDEEETEEW